MKVTSPVGCNIIKNSLSVFKRGENVNEFSKLTELLDSASLADIFPADVH